MAVKNCSINYISLANDLLTRGRIHLTSIVVSRKLFKATNQYKMSRFRDVKLGPPIEVFAVNKSYLDDSNPNKVNLSVGGKRKGGVYFSFIS